MRLILAGTLLAGAVAGLWATGQARDYRARAFVVAVPSDLGGPRGVELARSDRVLRDAVRLSRVEGVDSAWLRRRSRAEITSRLDLVFTVEAPGSEEARALAVGYAKAFRAAIPDDRGLPVRGGSNGQAQRMLGPLGWAALGGFGGLTLGIALLILRRGLRGPTRGSDLGPRRASAPCAPATPPTRG